MDDFTFPDANEGVQGVLKALRILTSEIRRHSAAITELQRDLKESIRGQERMERILHGDDKGKDSLIFQVAFMEKVQFDQQKILEQIKLTVEAIHAASNAGKWAIAEKIALALIGAVTAIAAALITGLLKH